MAKIYQQKGITLINLIITIVILLILASVAISIAVDGNGIFSRAKLAADSSKKANIEEEIYFKVLDSYDNYGNLDLDVLKEKLKSDLKLQDGNIRDTGTGSNRKLEFVVDGYEVAVDGRGTVSVGGKTEGIPQEGIESGNIKVACKKADLTTNLTGANINIYSDKECTKLVRTINMKEEYELVDNLAKGTYYLECTQAPEGFNIPGELTKVEVTENTTTDANVIFYLRSTLPEDDEMMSDFGIARSTTLNYDTPHNFQITVPEKFKGMQFTIYRIADFSELDFKALTEFENMNVPTLSKNGYINNYSFQELENWTNMALTHVYECDVPGLTLAVNTQGTLVCSDLGPGLYIAVTTSGLYSGPLKLNPKVFLISCVNGESTSNITIATDMNTFNYGTDPNEGKPHIAITSNLELLEQKTYKPGDNLSIDIKAENITNNSLYPLYDLKGEYIITGQDGSDIYIDETWTKSDLSTGEDYNTNITYILPPTNMEETIHIVYKVHYRTVYNYETYQTAEYSYDLHIKKSVEQVEQIGNLNVIANVTNVEYDPLPITKTFYVGLFEDEDRTKLVSGPIKLEFSNSSNTSTEIPVYEINKTYYLGIIECVPYYYDNMVLEWMFAEYTNFDDKLGMFEYPDGYELRLTTNNTTETISVGLLIYN